ncbi:MAG TPA: MT-A70 family methyltransferase [Polyangiaceae bacterium]|nr:MT-A70 family methyltransferase [Polyangiaceae bacterium]
MKTTDTRRVKPFHVVVADPAWMHGDQLPGPGRGASKHYAGGVMPTNEIMRFPLPPIARDAWLFMWRLHTHHDDALAVARAWGFDRPPVSEFVWVKQTLDGTRPRIGMGRTLRMAHEVCLVFRRGRPERHDAGVGSVILAPRLEHSRKPEEFFAAVDRLVGPNVRKLELFARRARPGWECIGDEVQEAAE